ncbi:TonB-dependent receptor family protein [Marinimicrobium alkaliphilum]|uniref:TonB-dependent receptor family protein n=1 Tax=Marinimicrobium alkaliphilum TaxID=2202654 RepID=UPI000DB9F874|nr:TonB-dependent receptor [Marinimicrobium alkaliphilum]
MTTTRRLLPVLVAAWSLAPVAQADIIDTLVVRGEQTSDSFQGAGAVSVSADEQIPGIRIDSAELLQGLPGLQADSRSNYAQDTRITVRGFGARSAFGVRGVDLQLDGIPQSTPDGQGQLSSVLLDEVSRVELLTGPVSALYGNSAGGVIALQTEAPTRTDARVSASAGENGATRTGLRGQWRENNLGARVQASRFSTDGDRPHNSAEREHLGGSFYHTSTNGLETVVRLDTSRDPLLQDPLGLSPEDWREDPRQGNPATQTFNTRKTVAHRQGSITVRQREGDQRWQAAAWRGQREVNQWLAFPGGAITSSGAVIDLTRDFAGVNASHTWDFGLLDTPASGTFGAEWSQQKDRRRGYVNDQGESGDLRRDELGRVDSRDIYGILQWQPAERWELLGGARQSWLEFEVDDYFIVPPEGDSPGNPDDSGARDYREAAGALSLSYQLAPLWQASVSAGWGFETPTLTEMAYRSDGTGLNTDLDPSRNRQQELNLRYQGAQALVLSAFRIDSRDELVVDQSVGGRTTFRNAAATEREGLEVSGRLLLAPGVSARYSASWLDAEYTEGEYSGNRLPGIARTQAYVQLDWQPVPVLTLTGVVRHRGDVATGDDNTDFAPSATTVDLALTAEHRWQDIEIRSWARLANVTDEVYVGSVIVNQGNGRSFEPAPERNVSAGIDLTYVW